MLANLIGQVDWPAAVVLIAISLTICIIATTMIAKRRSRLSIEHDFELAKMKEHGEQAATMAKLATERDYKFKQLDQNLITSHREDQTDGR